MWPQAKAVSAVIDSWERASRRPTGSYPVFRFRNSQQQAPPSLDLVPVFSPVHAQVNICLTDLNLSWNKLRPKGVCHVAEGLKPNLTLQVGAPRWLSQPACKSAWSSSAYSLEPGTLPGLQLCSAALLWCHIFQGPFNVASICRAVLARLATTCWHGHHTLACLFCHAGAGAGVVRHAGPGRCGVWRDAEDEPRESNMQCCTAVQHIDAVRQLCLAIQ